MRRPPSCSKWWLQPVQVVQLGRPARLLNTVMPSGVQAELCVALCRARGGAPTGTVVKLPPPPARLHSAQNWQAVAGRPKPSARGTPWSASV